MKDIVIIMRYAELYLKGKNRNYFENILKNNIRYALKDFDCNLTFGRSRYEVCGGAVTTHKTEIIDRLRKVFGLHSLSVAYKCDNDINSICDRACEIAAQYRGTFKISTNRADKTYPLTSPQVSAKVGGAVLAANHSLAVDVHKPDHTVFVDIREDGCAYVFAESLNCAGGMPVGSSGKGLLLLSGGIDSPVAGYMMAKRGLKLNAIHFHSYPYTSENAKQKVIDLAKILTEYLGPVQLTCIPFTEIQEHIHKYCSSNYMITLVRRFMMRIAERVAQLDGCGCLVNGESLGQVASQTLESITVTNDIIKSMPVFRPCIGMDKQEIIDIANEIGTYETSILPYEDCCTVFLPDSPVTKPTLRRAGYEEAKLGDFEELIKKAVDNREIIRIEKV